MKQRSKYDVPFAGSEVVPSPTTTPRYVAFVVRSHRDIGDASSTGRKTMHEQPYEIDLKGKHRSSMLFSSFCTVNT